MESRSYSRAISCTLLAPTLLMLAPGAASEHEVPDVPSVAEALRTRGAIVAVTHGNEPLLLGTAWQKMLLSVFPSLQAQIGGAILSPHPGSAASLVVWQNLGRIGGWSGPPPMISLVLTGDRGERLRVDRFSSDWHEVDGNTLAAFELRTYPRRGKQIRLHLATATIAPKDQANIDLPNPAPGDYPVWSPGPARQRKGDLELRLERFQTGVANPRFPRSEGDTQLDLHLYEHGKPAAHYWEVERLVISDPTGNAWEGNGYSGDQSAVRHQLKGLRPLFPQEPAYRVHLELARRRRFPPADLWTIRGLRIPPRGEKVAIGRRVTRHGCSLELTHLIGENGDADFGSEPAAVVRVTGPIGGYCLRAGSGEAEDYTSEPGGGLFSVELYGAEAGDPLTLKLALTPRVTFDFLAHASVPKPPHQATPVP